MVQDDLPITYYESFSPDAIEPVRTSDGAAVSLPYAVFSKNGKKGLVAGDGTVVLDAEYASVVWDTAQQKLLLDTEAAEANGIDADKLERLQWLQRAACYYWNLAAAENSEGAHNPTYYQYTLDMGNKILDEADELLGVPSALEA